MANPRIYELTDTWSDGATAFNAIKMNVTNTASAASSRLLSLQVSSAAKFDVTPDGQVLIPAGSASAPALSHIGAANHGWYKDANSYALSTGGTVYARFNYNRFSELVLTSSGAVTFTNGASTLSAADTAIERSAANRLKTTDAAGNLGDYELRKLFVNATNAAAGTTGAQTIDKAAGTVNFAAAATSLVVTNSLVSAASLVLCFVRTNDTTATIKNCVPGAGSFTITLSAAATAETSVGFIVIN